MDTTGIYYDEKRIVELYNSGVSQKNIADSMGTYNTTIRRILLRNKVPLRSNKVVQSSITHNPFIGDEKSNYFLGLLAADGNVYKGGFTLYSKDKELLVAFKVFTKSNNKIQYFVRKNGYGTYEGAFAVKHEPTYNYLVSTGIVENKSKILEMRTSLDNHFIRGVFDGDGTVTIINKKYKHGGYPVYSIATASSLFAVQLKETLEEFQPTLLFYKGIWKVAISKKEQAVKFYQYLYQDASIFLKRKKMKWNDAMET